MTKKNRLNVLAHLWFRIYEISSFLQGVSDINGVNLQTATFGDVLIHVGTSEDLTALHKKI
jgi:hypothetical protein